MQRAVLILAVVAACYEPPDYRGTHFACKKSALCPPGLICSEDHCVVPSSELVLVEHDPLFLITRDEATQADHARCAAAASCPGSASPQAPGTPDTPIRGLSAGAADAYCRYRRMRLPTDEEWSAAELAGVMRGEGVRCARTVE
jgi:hypothetical protein